MERRDPAVHDSFDNKEGRGEMTKVPIELQDLRRKIYIKGSGACTSTSARKKPCDRRIDSQRRTTERRVSTA